MAVLLLNVSKVFGVAGIIAVAANTFAFLRFHRKRLAPFENPIDESQELLARFPVDGDVDGEGFFFAIATASALDAWLKFPGGSEDVTVKEVEDGGHQEEMESGAQDCEQQLAEITETKDKNGGQQTKNASTLDVDEVSGNSQDGEGSRQNKSSHETALDGWELLNMEQMADKEQEPREQISEFSSVAGHSKSEVDNIDLGDQKDLPKMHDQHLELHSRVVGNDEKLLDPTFEGLVKGLENVIDEQTEVISQTNLHCLEERLSFWHHLDKELHLAKETNATVFRIGIDWSRIMPREPIDDVKEAINQEALDKYRRFIERVHAHGLRVMLTLFHHSVPTWASSYGGWLKDKTVDYFLDYTRVVVESFCDLVDFWITFNEPHVFALTEYCSGGQPNLLKAAATFLSMGVFSNVINRMARAHIRSYDIIHAMRKTTSRKFYVGISHHISFMRPYGLFDMSTVEFSNWMTRFTYVDNVCRKLDFLGINYYGQEFISSSGLKLVKNEEYSETGKGIYPDGLYRELLDFHNRYKKFNVPFIITENGVADSTDHLRRPYILEHLLAVKAAMNKGVPVKGYCYCSLSDNVHSLRFGLAAIDSESNLKRVPNPSYYLFSEVAKSGSITKAQRDKAWAELQSAVMQKNLHLICLSLDGQGSMYGGGVENRIMRSFVKKDWRFGHYKPDGLRDPLSCTVRCIWKAPHMIFRRQ